jgi:hypothetical protein
MAVRSTDTWYVSFETCDGKQPWGRRPYTRRTSTFQCESAAKEFANARLKDSRNVAAGTLNSYLPKRVICSEQIAQWIEEEEDA